MFKKLFIVFIILLVTATAAAEEHHPEDTLVIALRNDLPPLSFLNVDGEPVGFFVDMWKLWAEKTGRKIEIRLAVWNDTMEMLKNGTADIHGALYCSEERAQWMAFSHPVYEFSQCVFFLKNQECIESIIELKGKKIGVTGGTAQEQELRKNYPDIEIIPFNTIEDMIHAVREGKIRAFVSTPASVLVILAKLGLAGEFESTNETLFARKLHAGILKEHTELLALVNKGFDAISHKELAEIEARWVSDPSKRYYRTPEIIRLTAAEEIWVKNHRTVRVGMSPVLPPLKFFENGVIKGLEPDYLNLISEHSGIRFDYVLCTFSEMDSKVKSGELDMFISFNIPERLEYMIFTDPLMDHKRVIIARNDAPFISGLSSLKGKKVAIVKGVKLYLKLLSPYPDIQTLEVKNLEEQFAAVSESEADALISTTLFAGYLLRNYPHLKMAGVLDIPPDPYLYAVRKDYPELVGILNKAISTINKEQHDAIFHKWCNVQIEYRPNWSEILQWAALIGSLFIIILGISLFWNRRMAKEIAERKQAEDTIAKQAEFLRLVTESFSYPLYVIDINTFRIVMANSAANFGSLSESSVCYKVSHQKDTPCCDSEHICPIAEMKKTGKPLKCEHLHYKNGDVRNIEIHAFPIFDNTGEVIQMLRYEIDITDRRWAEDALRQSEEQFRAMFENHHAVMLLINPENGKIIRANKGAQKYYGYSAEEFERLFIYEINKLSKEEITAEMARARTENRNFFNFPHRLANGEIRDVEVHSSPIPFKGKELLFSIIHDITERKRAEEGLKLKNFTFNASIAANSIADKNGVIIEANLAFLRIWGYPGINEVLGRPISDFLKNMDEVTAIIQSLDRSGEWKGDYTAKRRDGSMFIAHGLATVLRNENGEIVGYQSSVLDITDRKRAEKSLRDSEERYRQLVELSPDAVVIDQDGKFVYLNPAGVRLIGAERLEELVGKDVINFITPEYHSIVGERIRKMYDGNQIPLVEQEIIRLNGEKRIVEVAGVSVIYNGKPAAQVIIRDITERKRAERAIQAKEEYYRIILQTAMDGLWVVDMQGRLLKVNDACCRMTGYSEEEMLCMKMSDLEAIETSAEIEEHIRKVISQGWDRFETKHRRKEGTVYDVEISVRYVPIEGGILVGFSRDITDRKRAEEALRESEARFRSYFELPLIGIAVTSPEKGWLEANDKLCEIFGYTRDQLMRMTWAEITYPDDLSADVAEFEKVLSGRIEGYSMEKRFIRKDGQVIYTDISVRCVRYLNGKVNYFIALVNDITERKCAEESLKESEETLKILLEKNQHHTKQIESLLEASKTVLKYHDFNEASKQIFYACSKAIGATSGYIAMLSEDGEENEILFLESGGRPCTVDPSLPMPIRGLRGDAYKLGKAIFENDFKNSRWMKYMPEGHTELENVMFAPLNLSGRTVGIIGLANKPGGFDEDSLDLASAFGEFASISLNNSINLEKLEKSRQAAESATLAKSVFLASMSHEIRTPMNVIIGMSHLIRETELSPEQREYADMVFQSSEILLSLIEDILDFSKIEAGKIELESVDFDLEKLIRKITDLLRIKATGKGLVLDTRIAPDTPRFLKGDPNRLRQIILNLVNNAVKFTEKGKITLSVENEGVMTPVESVPDDSGVLLHFSISDTGIGIPENRLNRLFQPFSQADSSTTRKYGGTGLGLTISKRLVELMGGQISVESKPGKGSTFRFTAQFEKGAELPEPVKEVKKKTIISDSRLAGLRVLLAEDNSFNQKMALIMLKKMGISADVASNGREAVEAVKHSPYDLILMDVQMPKMDGLEAARTIRNPDSGVLNPRIPIIAMTANNTKEDREKCLAAGMNAYLSKPVNIDELLTVIKKIMDSGSSPGVSRESLTTINYQTPGANIFDWNDFLSRFDRDESFCKTVLRDFPEQLTDEIEKLKTAVKENDPAHIKLYGHSIKGMCANISAYRLRDTAYQIELAGMQNNTETARLLAETLEEEVHALQSVLANFISDVCPPEKIEPVILSENTRQPLPQLISLLEKMLLKSKNMKETFLIDEVIEFSVELKSLGDEYQVDALAAYSKKLHESALKFDAYKMENILDQFPGMVDTIKKMI
jgi:PAS domain S-box-containing protein